jgi:hypothetical protein
MKKPQLLEKEQLYAYLCTRLQALHGGFLR